MGNYKKRESFKNRLQNSNKDVKQYFVLLSDKLQTYAGVKARISLRCDSFRLNKKLIAKLSLGGKSLKLYLALDPSEEVLDELKCHPRDMSHTRAYNEVPTMLPIKSMLAVKKAINIIEYMMIMKYHTYN